jgi:hypothetical protein
MTAPPASCSFGSSERVSVLLTDIALLGILAVAGEAFGFKACALIQGPVVFCRGSSESGSPTSSTYSMARAERLRTNTTP